MNQESNPDDDGRRYLWKVEYDFVFKSSSGSTNYSVEKSDQQCYVLTKEQDIPSVAIAVQHGLGHQCELKKIKTALYLGRILNEKMLTIATP
jgi:hypothetical protein